MKLNESIKWFNESEARKTRESQKINEFQKIHISGEIYDSLGDSSRESSVQAFPICW